MFFLNNSDINISYTILMLILNSVIFLNFEKIAKFINIYDHPDSKRKIHKKKVPLLGGIFLYFNFLSYIIFANFYSNDFLNMIGIFELRQLIFFLFAVSVIFIIGLYDDKYNLAFQKRLILLFLIIFFFLSYNPQIDIKSIKLEQLNIFFEINKISSILITVIIISYVISLNLFDGINLQVPFYFFITFLILIHKSLFIQLNLIFIIPLIFIIILNYKNKIFLGDSGVYIGGIIISYNLIFGYQSNIISGEIILLIVIMPIVDALRVFIVRISRGINPSEPGKQHIHHILLNKLGSKFAFILIMSAYLIPIIVFFVYDQSALLSLIIFIIFYTLILNIKYVKKY